LYDERKRAQESCAADEAGRLQIYPSFLSSSQQINAFFVKFFQIFLWRFCGISKGYRVEICFFADFFDSSKFFSPASQKIEHVTRRSGVARNAGPLRQTEQPL
jgi:hypothetical protein